jgi:hypothetical protein
MRDGDIVKYKILLWVAIILFGIFWAIAESAFQAFGVPEWEAKAILVVLLVLILGWIFKKALINSMPDKYEIFSANITDYPWHDEQTLRDWTTEFISLGFQYVNDYSIYSKQTERSKGFGRLLFHPTHRCYAEINQLKQGYMKPTEMRSVVASILEDGWYISTTNRIPMGTSWIIRRPNSLYQSFPEMSPTQLFHAHLQERSRIMTDLGVNILPEYTEQDYYTGLNKALSEQKKIMRKKPLIVIFAELLSFSRNPKYEWKGKYPEVAKARLTR